MSFKMFVLTLIGLTVPCLAFGQAPSPAVQRAFEPYVAPVRPVAPSTPLQQLCVLSRTRLSGDRPGTTVVVDAPTIRTRLTDPGTWANPHLREAAYRWMADELARTRSFTSVPTSAQLLTLARGYTPERFVRDVCARLPVGATCRPVLVWRATFLRDPWCTSADTGNIPYPSTATVLPRSMSGRVCLDDPSPGVRSGYRPCADERPFNGAARRIAGTPTSLVPSVPAADEDENLYGDAVGDAFGYGGLGGAGTGWGGGGTGEGTIGMGNIGTMGHASGAGSGQGFGTGAGRGLRNRGTTGPTVRAFSSPSASDPDDEDEGEE